MKWNVVEVLKDNYVWILYNENKEAICIDCGEFTPVRDFLAKNNLNLKYILITHSHYDHINGVKELVDYTGALVVGNGKYSSKLPNLDVSIEHFKEESFLNNKVMIFPVKGHCEDHVVYYFKDLKMFFVGDFIFSLGCGKLFDGTPKDFLQACEVLNNIPEDVLVFSGHEYTKVNLYFVQSLNYFDLKEREEHILNNSITLPTNMGFELKCNPFLNINNIDFKKFITNDNNMSGADFFSLLRVMKNKSSQKK